MVRRPVHRFRREKPFRLIYFIDGVRVPKAAAVRAVMLHLILSHAVYWDYAAAEKDLAQSDHRNPVEIGRFQSSRQNVWAEEQHAKRKKLER